MVAYSFKKRFAQPIVAGMKAQTFRADRTSAVPATSRSASQDQRRYWPVTPST
ncbi:hypothetical protein [Methylobacterium oxalidis]|uniref:hypothetical protein n=1 Tax=Methylobacterium oxalidis TaxID=944322 RepID=UPI0033147FE1